MPTSDDEAGLPIGEVLKRSRSRQKIEIRAVEARTKIRIKYLRALENEEWDVLPGPAYTKGFLRTYAQFLGLDGDALVDEYRRTVETYRTGEHPYPPLEPVLERRLRPGEESGRRRIPSAPVMAALGVVVVAVLVVLGLTGGSGEKGKHGHHHKGRGAAQRQGGGPATRTTTQPSQPVSLTLTARDDVEACLVPGGGRPLIDSQTLIAGSRAGPYRASQFRLDLDSGGIVDLAVNGQRHPLRSDGPVTYRISSAGVNITDFKGPDCP